MVLVLLYLGSYNFVIEFNLSQDLGRINLKCEKFDKEEKSENEKCQLNYSSIYVYVNLLFD